MVNQKSRPSQIDFWKKFDEEWAELNRHKNMGRRSSGSHGRNRVDPSKIWAGGQAVQTDKTVKWAGGQAVQTDKTVSKIYSSDKTHDGSQRPCRLVWMPSLLAIPFLPKSQHV